MAHLTEVLTSYDAVAPHVHDDMENLKVALTGFSDDHGCIAPKEWHAAMDHCMVLDAGSDDSSSAEEGSAAHDHSSSDDVAEAPECPDGKQWHEAMGHCM